MPVEAADCYKRRITKHAGPKEYPLPSAAMPRVRARLMAAFETIRNALQHPPLSLRNLVLACDHHQNPSHAHPNHPKSTQTRYGRGVGTLSPRGVRVAGLRCACATGARRASMLPSKKRGAIPPLLAHCARPPMLSMAHQPSEPAKTTLKHPPHNPSLSKTKGKSPPNGREGVARRRASWRLGEENGVVRHLNKTPACYKAWNINIILYRPACKQN